ncbi:MAG TPA: GNAT family N-acetyltransferase [Nitrospiria bacterium]|jgi:CelD/BcsL family acetyltransferase involved in cellulose biosynthesis
MEICLINRFDQINPEKLIWNRLAQKSGLNTIFQTYEWHQAWWEVFGDDRELFVIVAKEDGEVVGIAPLMITCQDTILARKRIVEFIGSGTSDYCNFITNESCENIIPLMIEFLFENRNRWDCLKLTGITENSVLSKILIGACSRHMRGKFFVKYSNSHKLVINNYDNEVKRVLRKKSLRRRQNHFRKQGSYEVDHLFDPAKIETHLNSFFEQHISRWKSSRTPSQFLNEKSRRFFLRLVENLGSNNWLLFSVIRSGGIPLAYHFGFNFNGILTWYTPSFNQVFLKYSPGQVLLKELLDYAIQERMDAFDFTIGSEEYKKRFSNETGRVQSFYIYSNYLDYELERMGSLFRKVVRLAT